MVDTQDNHFLSAGVDSVQNPVGPAARCVDAGQIAAQRLAYTRRVVDQGAGEELDDCSSDCLGELVLNRPYCRWGQNEFIRPHGRSGAESAHGLSAPNHVAAEVGGVGLADVGQGLGVAEDL